MYKKTKLLCLGNLRWLITRQNFLIPKIILKFVNISLLLGGSELEAVSYMRLISVKGDTHSPFSLPLPLFTSPRKLLVFIAARVTISSGLACCPPILTFIPIKLPPDRQYQPTLVPGAFPSQEQDFALGFEFPKVG